jgi:DNA-binding LacI/PurR family transcriptional regulator
MEIKLADIANELDLSVMTVSRSLRHDTAISPETRARVHEVARRLGYQGRARRARRAVKHDTKEQTLGLLLRHESIELAHRDHILMRMMGGILSVLDEHGTRLKMHTWPANHLPHLDQDPAALPPMIQNGECQALIMHGYHEERNLDFLSRRLPVVSMVSRYRDVPIDTVVADNADGIHRLVTLLQKLGHRCLAWVGTNMTWSFIEARQAGLIQGCLQHRLEINPRFFFGEEIWSGREIGERDALLAAVDAGVTAFVCGNDYVAFQLIQLLEAAGKRVPHDISVTGFDGTASEATVRQITSIDPGFFEIGRLSAELALRRMGGLTDRARVVSVRGELLVGNTTGPAVR